MEPQTRIYPIRCFQIDWDNPEDNIKVKDDMKVGGGIDTAKNSISDRNAPNKNSTPPEGPIQAYTGKFKISKNQAIRKIKTKHCQLQGNQPIL